MRLVEIENVGRRLLLNDPAVGLGHTLSKTNSNGIDDNKINMPLQESEMFTAFSFMLVLYVVFQSEEVNHSMTLQ